MSLRLLVVATETAEQQKTRRRHSGSASHETFAQTLRRLAPDAVLEHVSCVDAPDPMPLAALRSFHGLFFAGSPIQMHETSPETRAAAAFMQAVFAAGVPGFGSCAGLQIAAVAAGGRTAPRGNGLEAGFARDIVATQAGRTHPMLAGRPPVFDAPAMHSSVVAELPPGAILLAANRHTPVEAAEIRYGDGVFWGVQYHPEIGIGEIADSLRRQSADLLAEGLAASDEDLEAYAARLEALDRDPRRRDIAWQLGLDPEATDPDRRTTEIRNFLASLAGRPALRGAPADR